MQLLKKRIIQSPHVKVPIALHMYASFTIVIFFFFCSFSLAFSVIMQNYIENECNKRISNAVNSCQNFATAFRSSVDDHANESPDQIRDYLLKSIVSSTEISNEASIALISENSQDEADYTLLWPSTGYSASLINRTTDILDGIISNNGLMVSSEVNTSTVDNHLYYYKFVSVDYNAYEGENESQFDKYYLLFYVDSNTYVSFVTAINAALFKTMIMSIIIAGFASIFSSFPIIYSTHKITKFANRIGKGDFTKNKSLVLSRELNELENVMNNMAGKLDENDKEQKTFFQNASHELRTPLMSIQGYAEGIKYGVFDDTKRDEAIDIIISETTRLSSMVENLLSISKMDLSATGNYEVKKKIVNVYEMLGIVIDKVRGGFILNGKELENKISIGDVYIFANENDIFRMLENIFSNCLRYAQNSVLFEVYSTNNEVVFKISDDGPGISPEVLPNLFTRFAKGEDGKHGIGLALVKAICIEHNGTVSATNKKEGYGAVFEVHLPTTTPSEQLSSINNNKN